MRALIILLIAMLSLPVHSTLVSLSLIPRILPTRHKKSHAMRLNPVHSEIESPRWIPTLVPEATLLNNYLNPEPGDFFWTQFCQSLNTQDFTADKGSLFSTGTNLDFSWNNPIDSADNPDILVAEAFSAGPQSHTPRKIETPPTRLSDSVESSEISRSATDSSPRKRSRSSRSSSAEPDRQHERLVSPAAHQCNWATCSETFDQASQLRIHARIHASSQTQCQWGGCIVVSDCAPELKWEAFGYTPEAACLRNVPASRGYSKGSLPTYSRSRFFFRQRHLLLPFSDMSIQIWWSQAAIWTP
ncbi:hypothetical protein BGZ57DRAFT_984025 [Hyaloscypha finlandica]|nr:hypothetical protein BGZ57DRAFT_984025 [Hyaloscypha finlandica]